MLKNIQLMPLIKYTLECILMIKYIIRGPAMIRLLYFKFKYKIILEREKVIYFCTTQKTYEV
jgi:hypothetical protein